MLTTNEKVINGQITLDNSFYNNKLFIFPSGKSNNKAQHLYILSDEETKEGDWVKHGLIDIVYQVNKDNYEATIHNKSKKIIATTDNTIKFPERFPPFVTLPQIPKSFIEVFISEYNKGNIITDVMVEYEDKGHNMYNKITNTTKWIEMLEPKINPKDNTITIRKIKDSWNIKEMEEIHVSVVKQGCLYEGGTWSKEHERLVRLEFNKWIEENL